MYEEPPAGTALLEVLVMAWFCSGKLGPHGGAMVDLEPSIFKLKFKIENRKHFVVRGNLKLQICYGVHLCNKKTSNGVQNTRKSGAFARLL